MVQFVVYTQSRENITFWGFDCTHDSAQFNDQEEMLKFIAGEKATDWLDNTVYLRDDEEVTCIELFGADSTTPKNLVDLDKDILVLKGYPDDCYDDMDFTDEWGDEW